MHPPEPAAPPETRLRSWRRRGLLALTAVALPLAWTTYDIVNRGALYPYLLRRNRITYAESVLFALAFWALGMEAARHRSRGVRLVALTVLGVTAAFGIGGQSYFLAITHEYVARPAVLLAADMPAIITGFASSHALIMALYFAIPAIATVAFAHARARRFGLDRRGRWTSLAALGSLAALSAVMFSNVDPEWYQCLTPDMLWVHASGGPILRPSRRMIVRPCSSGLRSGSLVS